MPAPGSRINAPAPAPGRSRRHGTLGLVFASAFVCPRPGAAHNENAGDTTTALELGANTTSGKLARLRRYEHELRKVEAIFVGLGIGEAPRQYADGPMGDSTVLSSAYHQRRAIGVRGSVQDVRRWMALGKYGAETHSEPEHSAGPLRAYDVVIVVGVGTAWLHVILPQDGRIERDAKGKHLALIGGHPWVALSDYLEVGSEYVPFKRDGGASLHRQWGRIEVVRDIAKLARGYARQTGVPLGIGDISHVTGGEISDHMTHQVGEDVDVYLIAYDAQVPVIMWHSESPEGGYWSDGPDGAGLVEDADPRSGLTASDLRLRTLAQLALDNDRIAYFVHDAVRILQPFDKAAERRRPGKRFLHAGNRGLWPAHRDHVHLRWVQGPLPGGTPKP